MNPSKRVNKNPHVTPVCKGCMFESQDDPTERPCYQCVRKEMAIDLKRSSKEFLENYQKFKDYYKSSRNE